MWCLLWIGFTSNFNGIDVKGIFSGFFSTKWQHLRLSACFPQGRNLFLIQWTPIDNEGKIILAELPPLPAYSVPLKRHVYPVLLQLLVKCHCLVIYTMAGLKCYSKGFVWRLVCFLFLFFFFATDNIFVTESQLIMQVSFYRHSWQFSCYFKDRYIFFPFLSQIQLRIRRENLSGKAQKSMTCLHWLIVQ